ncbi:MAG: hypothetical protein KVP17_001276 [Porospora cf. gigantea B]|uniref:uncharacterized protein n=1 Tax=Porospora cf. gigantea B TaxID=2853592 RepID=UPI0035719A94|nr:MAG: hypothetical protein KVP17_001276 [Porospora cf. gigantea B]
MLVIRVLCKALVRFFFRDVTVVGMERIPCYGPVIFVGNHNNQFVDAVMLLASLPRYVRFMIAEASLQRAVIGNLAQFAGSIAVKRPQDCSYKGIGKITWISEALTETERESLGIPPRSGKFHHLHRVVGEGTKFRIDCKVKDLLSSTTLQPCACHQIISDTELITYGENAVLDEPKEPEAFKISPKMDQTEVYSAVSEALREGETIGIFPEGGSHDRTEMLPLKPGVAVMALNAAINGVEDIMIVPIGLHYYQAHKVMSDATFHIGRPVTVPQHLVDLYATDRERATNELLSVIRQGLNETIVRAPDYETLQMIRLCTSLYPPEKNHFSREKTWELYHLFSTILYQCDSPQMRSLLESLREYKTVLDYFGLQDNEVWQLRQSSHEAMFSLFEKCGLLLIHLVWALPFMGMWGPARMASHYLSEQHRQAAVKKSSVKIRGTDVIASYKIITLLMIFPFWNAFLGFLVGLVLTPSWGGVLCMVALFLTVLPFLYWRSISHYELVWPLTRNMLLQVQVLVGKFNIWRETERLIVTRRMEVQILLRDSVRTSVTAELQQKFDSLLPRAVLEADTRRLERERGEYVPLMPKIFPEVQEEIL